MSLSSIAVRKDDSALIYSRSGALRGLYRYTINGTTSSFSASVNGDGYPAFSPDETQLVFSSTSIAAGRSAVNGVGDVFLASIDADRALTNITNLTSSSTNEFAPVLALIPTSGSNTAPTANDQSLSTRQGRAKTAKLSATDTENNISSFAIESQPAHGTVVINNASTGAFTYTPTSSYSGPDAFTFTATDAGGLTSSAATVSITVVANAAPLASDSSVSTTEDTAKSGTLAVTDAESDALTYSVVSQPAHGAVVITNSSTGAFTLTPSANFNGSDTFSFKANDGVSDSNTATVSVSVAAVADNPSVTAFSPASATNRVGETRVFSITATDGDGRSDLSELIVLVNQELDWSRGATLFFSPQTSELTLRDNNTGSKLAAITVTNGAQTGSGTLDNGAVRVDGSAASVSFGVDGNSFTLSLPLQSKSGLLVNNKIWTRIVDNEGNIDPAAKTGEFGLVQQGTWTVNGPATPNTAPTVSAITPQTSKDLLDSKGVVTRTFTLTMSDADGASDISEMWLLAAPILDWSYGATVAILPGQNRVLLRSADASSWLSGAIGSAQTLDNGRASIDLTQVELSYSPDGQSISASVPLKVNEGLTGQNRVWGRVVDRAQTTDPAAPSGEFGFVAKALWNVNAPPATNNLPNVESVSPGASGEIASLTVGTEQQVQIVVSDADGARDLRNAFVVVGPQLDWTTGAAFCFDATNGLLYLRSDDASQWLAPQRITDGTFTGSNGTLSNGRVSIRLGGCSFTRGANGQITLSLALTPQIGLLGQNRVFLRAEDLQGNVDPDAPADQLGFVEQGKWNVAAMALRNRGSAPQS